MIKNDPMSETVDGGTDLVSAAGADTTCAA
jgi:hypothetical protein